MNIHYRKLFFTLLFFLQFSALNAQNLPKDYYISLNSTHKYSKDFLAFDYVNINAPKGGAINIGVIGNYDNLNDNILLGNSAAGLYLTTDSLLEKSLDELATSYMLLAEYVQFDQANNQVIFKIRDNAYWHDKSLITNQDVFFTFNLLRKSGHPYYKITFKNILGVEILPNNKIAFKFTADFSAKNNKIDKDLVIKIGQIPILSKKYYQNHQFNKITLTPPLASGPYKIVKLSAGKYITYERVEDYWAKDLNINRGRYNFAQIKYSYYRDINIAILGLKAGEYDLRFENVAKNWATSYQNFTVEGKKLIQSYIEHQLPTAMQAFILNNRLAKFSDKRVREALLLAFDYEWSNKNLFYGVYKRTKSFFANTPYKADSQLNWVGKDFLTKNITKQSELDLYKNLYQLPVTDGSGNNRKNLILARNLLNDAGWKVKNFKLENQQGQNFTIEFLITSRSFQRVILPYIKNLKKLGITAKIRMVDYSQYQKQIENFDFDIIVGAFPAMNIPGNEQVNLWHSKNANIAGTRNLAGIKNPLIDKLLLKIVNNDNYLEKISLLKLLDRILLNNHYMIPHWHINGFRLVYWDNKFAFPAKNPPYGLSLDSWWAKNN